MTCNHDLCLWTMFCLIAYSICLADTCEARPVNKSERKAERVYALLVVDTDDPILGEAARADLKNLQWLLEQTFDKGSGEIDVKILEGQNATPDKVLKYFADVGNRLNGQTALCYYSGHGVHDRVDGHTLLMGRRRLVRDKLISTLENSKPQLAILLTDCCNEVVPIEGERLRQFVRSSPYEGPYKPRLEKSDDARVNREIVRRLFFEHQGFVDYTAEGQDHKTLGDAKYGGYFTQAFVRSCCYHQKTIPAPPMRARPPQEVADALAKGIFPAPHSIDYRGDGFVDWRDFAQHNWGNHMAILYGQLAVGPFEAPRSPRERIVDAQPVDPGRSDISVMAGSAQGKIEQFGAVSPIGKGGTFVISSDEAAAKAYVDTHYPGDPTVMIARDLAHAESLLRKEYEKFRLQVYPKARVVEAPKVSLRPRRNREFMDQIREFRPK
jgi:hypothetical protein